MRIFPKQLAVLVAAGLWAGSATAVNVNFANTATRAVLIQVEDTPCYNPTSPLTPSPAFSAADPGCLVFANGASADFSDPSNDFYGILQFVSGTTWKLTVPSAVWGQVVAAVLAESGATFGSATDNTILFNTATGAVDPATPPNYWTGTGSFAVTPSFILSLTLAGTKATPDRPFFGSPNVGGLNVPLVFSCASSNGLATQFGPGFPGAPICDPASYIAQPGFAGTAFTAFDVASIKIVSGTPPNATDPVWAPFDWKLQETADADGDLVPDLFDNCPYTANPTQADKGGIGVNSPPDGIGDACQCGDIDNDGVVSQSDVTVLKRALGGLSPYNSVGGAAYGQAAPGLPLGGRKCNVNSGAVDPSLLVNCAQNDVTVISRAIGGLSPGIAQNCPAARP